MGKFTWTLSFKRLYQSVTDSSSDSFEEPPLHKAKTIEFNKTTKWLSCSSDCFISNSSDSVFCFVLVEDLSA